ncbi:hypothetical protein [Streptomyces zagrosensis]|uniref:Uncharacterized protein n=1 Tax=Streptomyces zagrosensis TaxID=1042984 RepID=A0A7W9UYP0_9ACTN|nr:hypothetical protein [Streptomyces zagrosensis]MBB5935551.1 hypothetical protein [Streptomyces zagrosensis]
MVGRGVHVVPAVDPSNHQFREWFGDWGWRFAEAEENLLVAADNVGRVAEHGQPALAAEGPDAGHLVVAAGEEGVQFGLGKGTLLRVVFVLLDVHRGVHSCTIWIGWEPNRSSHVLAHS